MMTKEEHIDYWLRSAEADWKVVNDLFLSANFVQSLFFAHLSYRKIMQGSVGKDKF